MPDPILFVAPGHGRRPDGTFDPGSIGADGRREHDEAHEVVVHLERAVRRCGIPTLVERHGTNAEEDPNYSGSIRTVNARASLRLALEVHYDYRLAPDSGFAIYHRDSSNGKRAAEAVARGFRDEGLPIRGDGAMHPGEFGRGDLAFLSRTRPPALIVECAKIYDHPDERNRAQAEGIARGACAFLGVRYVAPGGAPAPEPEAPPVYRDARFSDVDPRSPLGEALEILADAGVVTGYPDGTYRPGGGVNRGTLAIVLARLLERER